MMALWFHFLSIVQEGTPPFGIDWNKVASYAPEIVVGLLIAALMIYLVREAKQLIFKFSSLMENKDTAFQQTLKDMQERFLKELERRDNDWERILDRNSEQRIGEVRTISEDLKELAKTLAILTAAFSEHDIRERETWGEIRGILGKRKQDKNIPD